MWKIAFTVTPIALLGFVAVAHGQTAEEVVDRVVEARGGMETLSAVHTLVARGYQFSPSDPSSERSFEFIFASPTSLRVNVDFNGEEVVYACDSALCWMVNPEFDITDPVALPADAALELRASMDILGPFLDWQSRGLTVGMVGPPNGADGDLHVVRFTHGTGFYVDYYVDPGTFSIRKYAFPHLAAGDGVIQSFACQDYRDISGLMLPHYMESSYSPVAFRIVEYKINGRSFDDSIFSMPRRQDRSLRAVLSIGALAEQISITTGGCCIR
jgi:hypothetical protein